MQPVMKLTAMLLAAFASSGAIADPDCSQVGCVQQAPEKATTQQRSAADCSISPDLCMAAPVARGCGEGRHWSAAGSGLAHCVEDDRNCADGKPGKRDEFDNLICADEKGNTHEPSAEKVESAARVKA